VGLFEFIVGIAGAQSFDVGAADMRLGSKTIIYFISLSRFAQGFLKLNYIVAYF